MYRDSNACNDLTSKSGFQNIHAHGDLIPKQLNKPRISTKLNTNILKVNKMQGKNHYKFLALK